MRLIRIINQGDSYVVHAELDYDILGVTLFSRRKAYSQAPDSGDWCEISSSSKISGRKEQKLNKWISDHERYIKPVNKDDQGTPGNYSTGTDSAISVFN